MSKSSYLTGAFHLGLGLLLLGACNGGDGPNGNRNTGGTATQKTGGATASGTGGKPATQEQTGGMVATGGTSDPASGGTTVATGGVMEVVVPDIKPDDPFNTSDPARNDVTAGNVCDRVTQLQCAGEQECCSNPGRTFDECYVKLIDSCRNGAYLDSMSANSLTGFDPVRAKAAMEKFETLAMNCDITVASWAESGDGLRGILQGTKAEGTSCFQITTKREVAAANLASCQNPDTVSCLPKTTTSWICEPRGDVDATCVTDANCVPGLYCPQKDYLNPQLDSNCADRLADGSPCISNNECKSYACKAGACAALDVDAAYCLQ